VDDSIVTDTISPLPGAGSAPATVRSHHLAWLDLRDVAADLLDAVVQAALHHGVDGLLADRPEVLTDVPPTVTRAVIGEIPGEVPGWVDVVIADGGSAPVAPARVETGVHVVVDDGPTLTVACDEARVQAWTVITFTDPTKIPLEIVIAAAENADGRTLTVVHDLEDAEIVIGVLEHGSDGVLLSPSSIDDVHGLVELCGRRIAPLQLSELTVESITHVGMGDRACIDTCSLLEPDEGMLIGSFATAMVLSCSETHPLPYMPTRPFRINAGAVHTYIAGPDNRTNYLSELRAGHRVLAARVDGTTREVVVGRVKIERRPLLSIDLRTPDGDACNLIVQDDWHVRLLGPGGSVNNVTELRKGDVLLGHVPPEARHVGLPISEFCVER